MRNYLEDYTENGLVNDFQILSNAAFQKSMDKIKIFEKATDFMLHHLLLTKINCR